MALLNIENRLENWIGVGDVFNRTVGKNQPHALFENLPFVDAEEAVAHQETAAFEIRGDCCRLLGGQIPRCARRCASGGATWRRKAGRPLGSRSSTWCGRPASCRRREKHGDRPMDTSAGRARIPRVSQNRAAGALRCGVLPCCRRCGTRVAPTRRWLTQGTRR